MPVIQVNMREGRGEDKIRKLISALTDAVVESIDAPKESVRIIVNEVPGTHFAAGNVTLDEKRAAQNR